MASTVTPTVTKKETSNLTSVVAPVKVVAVETSKTPSLEKPKHVFDFPEPVTLKKGVKPR